MAIEDLVAESLSGNVDAFTELVKRYQAMAYGYALATIGDAQLAEDAAQQAFLTAYRNLGALRDRTRFGGWLRGIVRFESLRIVRDGRAHPAVSLDRPDAIEPVDKAVGPEAEAEAQESLERATRMLARLPERQRVVAILFYIYQFSQRDVAAFLGLSISAVNNRLREARISLRKEGQLIMAGTTSTSPDFARRIGAVLRADGSVIDAKLDGPSRPGIMSTLQIGDGDRAIAAFVAQYLDDDVARLVVVDRADAETVTGGAVISNRDEAVTKPIDNTTLEQVIAGAFTGSSGGAIETGIKVIDLFAPLTAGGTVAIVGDMNVGKMVVVEELVARLAGTRIALTILVFLGTPDETGLVHRLEFRINGDITVIGIPVSDASLPALASSLDRIDSVIVMDRSLGQQRRYPAIDPLASRSTANHGIPLIDEARALLGGSSTDARAAAIRDYLTQPFYVAEAHTNLPGIRVSREVAESDLQELLHGDLNRITRLDLVMAGSLASVMKSTD